MLFIRDSLNEDDTIALLLHECCHIYLDHPATDITINNTDVKQEREANHLADLILSIIKSNKRTQSIKRILIPISFGALTLALTLCVGMLISDRYNDSLTTSSQPVVAASSETSVSSNPESQNVQSSQSMNNQAAHPFQAHRRNISLPQSSSTGRLTEMYTTCLMTANILKTRRI